MRFSDTSYQASEDSSDCGGIVEDGDVSTVDGSNVTNKDFALP